MELPKRKQVICRGYDDEYSFCRALKGGKHSFQVAYRIENHSSWVCLTTKHMENMKFLCWQ